MLRQEVLLLNKVQRLELGQFGGKEAFCKVAAPSLRQ